MANAELRLTTSPPTPFPRGLWLHKILAAPVTLIVVAVCVTIHCMPTWQSTLAFSHTAGDSLPSVALRMISGHLTHWTWNQLFWDVLAFGVLGYFCEQAGRRLYVGLLGVSSLVVSLSVLWTHPELASYRGMSGVDSALFVFLACHLASEGWKNRDRIWTIGGIVAWFAFVSKVAYEYFGGGTMFVESAGEFLPLPISHVAGAAAGTLVWWIGYGCCNVWTTSPIRSQ